MKMKKAKRASRLYEEDLKEYLTKIIRIQIPIKDESFKKKIRTFRRRWKIPIRGFKNKKLCEKWLKNPSRDILKRPKTVKQIEREIVYWRGKKTIVKQYVPKIVKGLRVERKIDKFPFGSFLTDVSCFMIENKIDGSLKMPFLYFLYYNKLTKAPFPERIVEVSEKITFTKSHKKAGHLINLTFGPNARQKDILTVWSKHVVPLQRKIPDLLTKKTRNRKAS